MKKKNIHWLALVSLGIILDLILMVKDGISVTSGVNLLILLACGYALAK